MLKHQKPNLGHAMLAMVLASQVFAPRAVALAAVRTESLPADSQLVIRQAEPSLVMLTGETLAKAQEDWHAKMNAPKPAVAVRYMTLSAYNSFEEQCDASPYATAIGSLSRDGIVASSPNLPIGTRVRFPDYFGDKEFRVEDRMNTRYENNIDIWMESHSDALKFGRRYAKIEVVEWGKGRGMY